MVFLKLFFSYLFRLLASCLAFVICYFFLAFWLPLCRVNRDFVQPKDGIEIFIESNGVHSGYLLPARSSMKDWFGEFPCSDFQAVDTSSNYISIGWGDRGFYLYTPTWSDLKFSTAFKAAFGLDSAAMHVNYQHIHPKHGEWIKRLLITRAQYQNLIEYIHTGFKKKDGKLWHIQGHPYGTTDCFYEGTGSYSLFKTCNVWTNEGLKMIGVKTGLWTPFEDGVRTQF